MQTEIVRFFFTKIDGTIREAWGTLKNDLVPETKGIDRKKNENVFTYFDIEKNNWRSCKKENILI